MALLTPTLKRSESEWLAHFDLNHDLIEEAIHERYHSDEFYVGHGLSSEALYTSFGDYEAILTHPLLKKGERLVDLGAGLGKGTLLAREYRLALEVLSLEFVKERHLAGKKALARHNHPTREMIHCDLRQVELPLAQHYFIYLPTGPLLSHLLDGLKARAKSHHFYLWAIESHGDLIPTLKNFAPFLQQRESGVELSSVRHDQKLYLFESCNLNHYEVESFPKQNEILKALSNPSAQLVIEDQDLGGSRKYQWLADLKGLSMGIRQGHLQASFPPREFAPGQIQSILSLAPAEFAPWIAARNQEIDIPDFGKVRKIIIAPTKMVEFSLAGRVALAGLS